jgi:hypothetical protein
VLEQFAANLPKMKALLIATLAELPVLDGSQLWAQLYGAASPSFEFPPLMQG